MNARTIRMLLLLPLMALAGGARADDTAQGPAHFGDDTRAWIQLQERAQGDDKRPPAPVPGEVADKIYQRYLDSFGHALPETFPRDSFTGGSGSGGGSGGGSGSSGSK